MTSDITVDNKTGTLSIFIAETLADGNFSCFYYLRVAQRSLSWREYPIGWDVAPPRQANAISCAPAASTEWSIPVAARNALRGPSPVSKRPA